MAQDQATAVLTIEAHALSVDRPPDIVLAEAHRAARALQSVIDQKSDKIMMGGRQYLEFQDWQTVGHFYGVTAKEDGDPEYIEIGKDHGFLAHAVAIDNHTGREVSRASAYCMTDEEKWGSRPKYVYAYVLKDGSVSVEEPQRNQMHWVDRDDGKPGQVPEKRRTLQGEECVPLFQMASMAQTRACSKVLRNVLSWVAVLAGYSPTPAEELDGMADRVPNPSPAPDRNQDVVEGEFTAPSAQGSGSGAETGREPPAGTERRPGPPKDTDPARQEQIDAITNLSVAQGINLVQNPIEPGLNYGDAKRMIKQLQTHSA